MVRNIGQSRPQFRRFVEPVIGLADSAAVVFVGRTVKAVGPALGHQRYLRSRRAAFVGVAVAGGHAEFLQRVERGPQGTLKGDAQQLIVVVQPIERNVGLVAARAADRAATTVV